MIFTGLFIQKPQKHPFAEGEEGAKSQSIRGEVCATEGNKATFLHIRENPRVQPSAPSAPAGRPPLVPVEAPFRDGQRYRLAGATEVRSRLDLYLEDPTGPWVRRHGVLMVVPTKR
jgi:hypothetical protein